MLKFRKTCGVAWFAAAVVNNCMYCMHFDGMSPAMDTGWVLHQFPFRCPIRQDLGIDGGGDFQYQNGPCTFAVGYVVGASLNFGTLTMRAKIRYLK